MRRYSLVLASLLVVYGAAGALAQDNPPQGSPSQQNADPSNPFAMWNVQQMIDRASSQIVKRYTLTPEQEEYTRNVMTTRVNAFLDRHEQEIREIFAEVIKYQMSGNPPPPEKVREWTARVTPMFEEAKAEILEGNREFRDVLSDDQKKIHDIDLRIMEQNFKDAEKRLDRWREGGFDAETDLGERPAGKPAAPQQSASVSPRQPPTPAPPTPPQPTPVSPPQPTVATPAGVPASDRPTSPAQVPGSGHIVGPVGRNVERTADFWELYVRKFIYDYKLDQPQSNQALQILADAKKQAGEYLTSHSMDYERLQTRLAEAAGDAQAVAEIQKQMTELNKPLQVDMFNEMKERLDKIPTEAQREAQADSRPRRGMANAVHGAATAPGSRPRAIASRPWATRPATASRPSLRRSPASASATRSRTVASRPAAHR